MHKYFSFGLPRGRGDEDWLGLRTRDLLDKLTSKPGSIQFAMLQDDTFFFTLLLSIIEIDHFLNKGKLIGVNASDR
jgi:hypothetical protein